MRLSFVSLALALHLTYVAYGVEVIFRSGNLQIVNKQLSPDGFKRSTVVAGASAATANFPGPLIQGYKGDIFNLNVVDSLNDPTMNQTTSIHWHGLFQEHTNWADGASMVTQCPIAPGHSFLYSFPVPDQAGTFWYHSHLGAQYCDGLRGPFVVYDPFDPLAYLYDIDDENTVITLADWYHPTSLQILASFAAPASNATLINGKGRYPENPTAPLAVINVQHGKRYRFRLISMSCDPAYTFSIDGHNLTIIETDGIPTKPVTVNSIPVFAAQRYSFVLNANQPIRNYWMRALPSVQLVNAQGPFTGGINSAILRYSGAPNADPTTSQQTDTVSATEDLLHPLVNPGAPGKPFPGGVDKVINMTLGFIPSAPPLFTVNDTPFESPSVPVLLQILSGAQAAQNLLPAGSVYSLPKNKVIEINFFGGTAVGGPHPFHLHGHAFDVIKSAGNPAYNFKNPVRRDVTAVAQGDQTTIRFVTDNSGPWFLHCHIDWHLAAGLAVVMAEDVPDVKFENPVPADWNKLCPIYNALKPSQL